MRVVLLAPTFPPHPHVGSLRAQNIANAFLAAGHEVTVVTQRVAGVDYDPDRRAPGNLRMVPVDVGERFGRRLLAIAGAVRPTRPLPDATPDQVTAQPSGFFRRAVLSLLSVPDNDQHLIRPFMLAGASALREGADLLYTTAPPFSIQVAGYLLRRRFDIPWVAEYRDPWNHPWTHRTAVQSPLIRRLDAWLEERALRRADALVFVTEAARDLLAGRLPVSHRHKLILARNGIPDWDRERLDRPGAATSTSPFTLVHAGSLYLNRNPIVFFDGLARLVTSRTLGPEDIQVHLMGQCREYQGRSVEALVAERGLSSIVRIDDWMPHDRARARMLEADGLVLFAQDQPMQVPNKLYEYLAAGAPILAFVDRGGESARVLHDAGGAELLHDAEPAAVAEVLERLYDRRTGNGPTPKVGREDVRSGLSTATQMRDLVSELERRFSRRTSGREAG